MFLGRTSAMLSMILKTVTDFFLEIGTRSDFLITQHPEFNLGRLASEKGRLGMACWEPNLAFG